MTSDNGVLFFLKSRRFVFNKASSFCVPSEKRDKMINPNMV